MSVVSHVFIVGKAVKTGALPGVTKDVGQKIRILDTPAIFLIDSPGILEPRLTNIDSGLKLALVACIKDGIVDSFTLSDFLLYKLNQFQNKQ